LNKKKRKPKKLLRGINVEKRKANMNMVQE